jgi:outer membrane murein-binding lipoprotein Lpp
MSNRRRWFVLVVVMLCCLLVAGCSELLNEDENMIYNGDSTSIGDLEDTDDAFSMDGLDNESEEQAANRQTCYSGEVYISEEDVCSIPLGCNDAQQCELWGGQQVERLLALYGSFVEVEGIELSDEEEALSEEDEDIIVTYPIEADALMLDGQETEESYYESLWDEFAWIIPQQHRWMLTSFSIFSHVDTLAYVVQEDDDWESWSLGINVELNSTMNETVGTLTHEFGHLLFLNSNELDPYGDPQSCHTIYMEETGCLYEDSYLYDFKELFWHEDEYEFSEEEFVSEYAAGHIDEDMAESWMHFVLAPKPLGDSIAEQKVLFFYQYDELIHLRAEMLSRVATLMERAA